jgi:hypothetical protein
LNIEFRASPLLYTVAQYIKTSTMIKIRKEKKYMLKNFFKSLELSGFSRSTASDRWRSQPLVEVRPKIKYNNLPFANASEKRRI